MFDARRLMNWYSKEKRTFPWRTRRDPYSVWICEVMSQQTTLAVVLPFFERFVAELPDLKSLAHCEESLLRNLWKGLGYYSRVRNLQKGALQILELHGGRFPQTYNEWLKISGCGPYTAAVIASVCFQEPVPCIDGNVLRVMARQSLYGAEIHTQRFQRQLRSELQKIIVTESPGDFNQALMELGATVCTPRRPLCRVCPVSETCLALFQNRTLEYPKPKPRATFKPVTLVAFVVKSSFSDEILLIERNAGFLKKTVGFPLVESNGHCLEEIVSALSKARIKHEVASRTCQHTITRHKLSVHVVELTLARSKERAFFAAFFGFWKDPQSQPDAEPEALFVQASDVAHTISTSLDSKVWSMVYPKVASRSAPQSVSKSGSVSLEY